MGRAALGTRRSALGGAAEPVPARSALRGAERSFETREHLADAGQQRQRRIDFGDYVDLAFTAEMEEILDKISNGEKDWLVFLAEFYRGDGWYVDGPTDEFELYNAWMFGWHYLLWTWIDGDRRPGDPVQHRTPLAHPDDRPRHVAYRDP